MNERRGYLYSCWFRIAVVNAMMTYGWSVRWTKGCGVGVTAECVCVCVESNKSASKATVIDIEPAQI